MWPICLISARRAPGAYSKLLKMRDFRTGTGFPLAPKRATISPAPKRAIGPAQFHAYMRKTQIGDVTLPFPEKSHKGASLQGTRDRRARCRR